MNLVEGKFGEDKVTVDDALDALIGVCEQRTIERMIAVVEEEDGTLLIVTTDMTNTELVGTLQIVIHNYIHQIQHQDE